MIAVKRATYQDLEALPEHQVGQIIDGELIVQPRPAIPHARAASKLGSQVGSAFDDGRGGPGGWVILDEPELHFGDDVLVPDLAGWRRERMPEVPAAAFVSLASDWVTEVLSPSTSALDRAGKLPIYATQGVRHVWLVDPLIRTLESYRLTPDGYLLLRTYGGSQQVRAQPFEAVSLDLACLWPPQAPAP